MHLYKYFWKLIARNKQGIIIYAVISIVMMIIAVSAVNGNVSKIDENGKLDITESLDISYIDYDDSVLSKGFINYLSKNNNLVDYKDKSNEEISNMLYFETVTFHIVIPKGFQEEIVNEDVNVEYSTSLQKSAYVYQVENLIDSYINVYLAFINKGMSPNEAVEKTDAIMDQEVDITVYSENKENANNNPKEYIIYFAALYLTYLSFGMLAMSVGRSIISANKEKISSRIVTAPVSEIKRTTINTLGLYSFALLILVFCTVLMYVYAGDTNLVKEKGLLIIINTFIALLYNCSMTSIIAALNIKENVISMIVNIVGLAMSFLCGIFVPIWLLGDKVLAVAKFLPFYWTVNNLSIIYPESGAGLSFDFNLIIKNYCIAFVYVIAFALIAMLIRKINKK